MYSLGRREVGILHNVALLGMNDHRSSYDGGDGPSRRGFRGGENAGRSSSHHHQHPPPEEGSIFEGTIQRIQPYGAFCSFGPFVGRDPQRQRRAWQGLIHISQLSDTRVEKVEDVVDVDDAIWIKVLEVEKQDGRHRIKLSMKDVSQDGRGQDLGKEREAKEQVTTQLQTNLNSMIGMGVALDPMERIVLKNSGGYGNKNSAASTKTTFRGGYTLVGDDEGEPEPDPPSAVAETTNKVVPMGRGRGATLPAWMTSNDGPVGASSDRKSTSDDRSDADKYRDDSDDDDRSRKRSRDRKRHKKKSRHKHKHRKRSRHYSDDEDDDESLGSSHSGHGRKYDDEKRHRKRHKSSRKSHKRRKSSSRKKDKKRRKESRHYKNDESSHDDASISDSGSSYSSRGVK